MVSVPFTGGWGGGVRRQLEVSLLNSNPGIAKLAELRRDRREDIMSNCNDSRSNYDGIIKYADTSSIPSLVENNAHEHVAIRRAYNSVSIIMSSPKNCEIFYDDSDLLDPHFSNKSVLHG